MPRRRNARPLAIGRRDYLVLVLRGGRKTCRASRKPLLKCDNKGLVLLCLPRRVWPARSE